MDSQDHEQFIFVQVLREVDGLQIPRN